MKYYDEKRYGESVIEFSLAVLYMPGVPHFLFHRAEAAMAIGKLEQAHADYRAALALEPNNEVVWSRLAQLEPVPDVLLPPPPPRGAATSQSAIIDSEEVTSPCGMTVPSRHAARVGTGGVVCGSGSGWARSIVHGRRYMDSSVRRVLASKIDSKAATGKLHKAATG